MKDEEQIRGYVQLGQNAEETSVNNQEPFAASVMEAFLFRNAGETADGTATNTTRNGQHQ